MADSRQTLTIDGRAKLCFVVREGEEATFVITMDSITPADYKRLKEFESKMKADGDMMAVMRDTKLDNGMNALVQFEPLIKTIRKPKVAPSPAAAEPARAAPKRRKTTAKRRTTRRKTAAKKTTEAETQAEE